ncbi:MAG: hypothetical protein NCW75_08995 [Phycisphaera sp.]|nr:MAG: hypothetical protein NCW75_08995 [Phycisphaera sp.]
MPTNLDAIESQHRQRHLLVTIVRVGFFALFLTVATLFILRPPLPTERGSDNLASYWWMIMIGAAIIGAVAISIDLLTPRKKIATLVSIFVGLVLATAATLILWTVIDVVIQAWGIEARELMAMGKILLGIGLAYLAIVTVLQTQDDLRLVIPYVEFSRQIRGPQPWLLDSSALIDGRVVAMAETGLFQSRLIVAQFVLDELQRLSDSHDKMKRSRGRAGLDAVRRLQRSSAIEVSVEAVTQHAAEVDQALIEMGGRTPATIITTDSGLERAANIHGVRVLNLHTIAQSMRSTVMPGERIEVNLLRAGEQQGQAVGYLDDGTMIVAEDGGSMIGERVMLTVRSTLQTSAGRLVFARANEESSASTEGTETPAAPNGQHEEVSEADTAPEAQPPTLRASPPARAPARPRTGRNPRR